MSLLNVKNLKFIRVYRYLNSFMAFGIIVGILFLLDLR